MFVMHEFFSGKKIFSLPTDPQKFQNVIWNDNIFLSRSVVVISAFLFCRNLMFGVEFHEFHIIHSIAFTSWWKSAIKKQSWTYDMRLCIVVLMFIISFFSRAKKFWQITYRNTVMIMLFLILMEKTPASMSIRILLCR